MISSFEASLCEIQGRLFALSGNKCYESQSFIKSFMKSDIARDLDSDFNFMQWAGKEYILERIEDELPDATVKGDTYNEDVLFG